MKNPGWGGLLLAALLAVLAPAVGAVDTRNRRAQVQAEAQIAAELRGAREQRQHGAAKAVHEAVAEGGATGRLSKWVHEVGALSNRLCFPLLTLWRERRGSAPAPPSGPPADGAEEESSAGWAAVVGWFVSEGIYLTLCLIVAYAYKAHKDWFLDQTLKDPSEKDFKKWSSPALEPILLWSCLCPGVRWADSMAMSNLLPGFWQAFLLFFAMCMITGLSLGLPGWILMTSFLTFYRMRMRAKFGMEASLLCDFCGYCWCLPCLVAQEARHVEDAKLAGHEL